MVVAVVLMLAGACSRPGAPAVPHAKAPVARPIPALALVAAPQPAAPAAAVPAAPVTREAAVELMEEQIADGTMFCVESRAHDCPAGFACVDGACEPSST
jgi:hypothetical protein